MYGFAEASRLARVDSYSARRWFLGRSDTHSGPVLHSDIPQVGDKHAVSFLDLRIGEAIVQPQARTIAAVGQGRTPAPAAGAVHAGGGA